MTLYIITYIAAGDWGRSAYGPDWHGDTTGDFYELFSSVGAGQSYTMTYDVYCLVDAEYRIELDEMANVTITDRPETCTPGDTDTVTCADGSIVTTRTCDHWGEWVDFQSDCTKCHNDPVEDIYPSRYRVCDDGTKVSTHQCIDEEWVPVDRLRPDEECIPGTTKTRTCDDGAELITHTCVDHRWAATGNRCPEDPEPAAAKSSSSGAIVAIGIVVLVYLLLTHFA